MWPVRTARRRRRGVWGERARKVARTLEDKEGDHPLHSVDDSHDVVVLPAVRQLRYPDALAHGPESLGVRVHLLQGQWRGDGLD